MDFLSKLKQLEEQKRLVSAFEKTLSENGAKISQSKSLADVSFYHSLAIETAKSAVFFEGNASTSNTNLRQFIRPEGEHVVITALEVLAGNNATLGSTDWTPLTTGDAYAKNATMTVYANGIKVLDRYPLADFIKDVDSDEPATVELMTPIFWGGQTELRVEYSSTVGGAASDNLRIGVKGIGLI